MKFMGKSSSLVFTVITSVVLLYTGSMVILNDSDAFAQTTNGEIRIAFLSDFGHTDAFNYAVDRFNQEQSAIPASNYQITSKVVTVSNDTIVDEIKLLEAAGYTYFVGPLSSSSAAEAKTYADSTPTTDLVFISPSSTAESLIAEGDSLFRLVPSDDKQVPHIMERVQGHGKEHIVLIYRDDTWGIGIRDIIARDYSDMLSLNIPLHPDGLNSATVAAQAATKVKELVTANGADKVAVILLSFNTDTIPFVEHIASDTQLSDTLGDVRWYGADGISQSSAIASNADVSSFLSSVRISASQFEVLPNPINRLINSQSFTDGISFADGVYDAVFLLADTIIVNDEELAVNSGSTVRSLVLDVARNGGLDHDHHHSDRTVGDGALGEFTLNDAGDLSSPVVFAPYEIYQKSDGTYDWRVASDTAVACR